MPLSDLKVVDCSTVIAGPQCARYLADFGADVVKVERPGEGDGTRTLGWRHPDDGVTLWWRIVSRGKRVIRLDFKNPDDLARMRELCADADVLVENFRPGTLERLGLDPVDLIAANPKLVVVRVTGFGQDGPYRNRPGFATLAEAMSGFAAVNGSPDGPPLLPPVALADEVTGLAAAFATMVAVHSGVGQVVDVNLIDSLMQMMGPLIPAWKLLGYKQPRLGAGIPYTVPRGTYRTRDGDWIAVSTSSQSVAMRLLALLGVAGDARFADFNGRADHRDELDGLLTVWLAERTTAEAMRLFEAAEVAAAPVLDIEGFCDDPHVVARGSVTEVDGIPMYGLLARLSETPGKIRWPGPA